jgi:hypothetical protein
LSRQQRWKRRVSERPLWKRMAHLFVSTLTAATLTNYLSTCRFFLSYFTEEVEEQAFWLVKRNFHPTTNSSLRADCARKLSHWPKSTINCKGERLTAYLLFYVRSRIFHVYGDVIITVEGLQNLSLCSVLRAFWAGRDLYISYQTCCGTGPRFFRSHPKDHPIQSPLKTRKGMRRTYYNPHLHDEK